MIFQQYILLAGGQEDSREQPVSKRAACQDQCPDGWTYFRGSCYLFVDNMSLDWTEAIHHCSIHHGQLATIETKAEDLFIQDMAKRLFRNFSDRMKTFSSFWLGASDSTVEGLWTWYTDDSDLMYTNWSPGQPDSHLGVDEDCLVLFGPHNYTWDDASCTMRKHHPLCEIDLTQEEIFG
ncbi:perlucin-like [Mercenaria mercenaria]|uniref:perlucin-like n=1 Tax=Mercenaria mercenaria TaxID=6596 RepID=UPI00234F2C31|nr:perlucin-like [Mercenaria mercenaria]